jgi:hypothetical protein
LTTKKSHKLAYGLGILGTIIVTLFIASNYSAFVGNDVSSSAEDLTNKLLGGDTDTKFTGGLYDDDLTMQNLISNGLNGTSYTDSTQVDVKYSAKTGGGEGVAGEYEFLAESTGGTIDIPTRLLTDNKVYAELVIPSDQPHLVDIEGTTTANVDLVKNVFYGDLDKIGAKHYVFGLDVSDKLQESDPANQPKETFIIRLFGEGSLAITAGATASIGSHPTGDKEGTFEFDPTFALNSEAETIAKLKVTVNSTSTSLWSDNDSSVTLTQGKVGNTKTWNLGSDFLESTNYSSSTKIYEKTFSSTIDGGNLVYVPSSGGKKIEATLNVGTTMTSATDALCFELEITTVNAQGTETTISDDVELTADSVGDECSV